MSKQRTERTDAPPEKALAFLAPLYRSYPAEPAYQEAILDALFASGGYATFSVDDLLEWLRRDARFEIDESGILIEISVNLAGRGSAGRNCTT